ncbi:ParB N-terminal domain-containing protein [Streptomyces diastatochromogenes]|nr:ParB N-terminal domain-containing protein [Streptomyces diastatochromogenes]
MAGMPQNLQLGASREAAEQQRLFSKGTAEVPVTDLLPSPENGRKRLRAVQNLADSFDDDGVVQALTVVPAAAYIQHYPQHREHVENSKKPFVVIHGHRRLAAATQKGLAKVPVFIRKTVAENGSLRLSAIKENEQRLGLDPIEAGADYQAALDELGISQRELVRRLGNVSQTVVSHKIKLLKLIEPLQHAVIDQWCKQNNLEMEFGGKLLLSVKDAATVLASLREDLQQQFVDGTLSFEDAAAIVKSKVPLEDQRVPSPPEPAPQPEAASGGPGETSREPAPQPPRRRRQPGRSPGRPRRTGARTAQHPEASPAATQTGPTPPAPEPDPETPTDGTGGDAPAPQTSNGEGTGGNSTEVSTLTERGVIPVTTVKDIYTGLKERLSPEEFTELQELILMD